MNAMEKFVSTVQEMDETILVPCRLMDLKIGDASDMTAAGDSKTEMQTLMKHADLYSLYTMVNSVKNELLWGHNNTPSEDPAGPLFVSGVVVGEYSKTSVSSDTTDKRIARPSIFEMMMGTSVAMIPLHGLPCPVLFLVIMNLMVGTCPKYWLSLCIIGQ